jgi:hypothetical protein
MSVVEGECPPLFSRQCMTALGMDISCSRHATQTDVLEALPESLTIAGNGHYIMDVVDFGDLPLVSEIDQTSSIIRSEHGLVVFPYRRGSQGRPLSASECFKQESPCHLTVVAQSSVPRGRSPPTSTPVDDVSRPLM